MGNIKDVECFDQELHDKDLKKAKSEFFGSKKKKKKKARKSKKKLSPYATTAKSFYKSQAWMTLRYIIIKKHKGCCVICGRNRKEHGVVMHCDHIVPLSKDWSLRLEEDNIQLLCADCNLGKSNTDSIDWR